MAPSLIYIHIGNELPECLYDSLYQTLLFNNGGTSKIYVIISKTLHSEFLDKVNKFNLLDVLKKGNRNGLVEVISLEEISEYLKSSCESFKLYNDIMKNKFVGSHNFRNGFWVSTTARFFYIAGLIELHNLKEVFHIENDVIIYDDISKFLEYINKQNNYGSKMDFIYMVQDSPSRVIPSILYFPNHSSIKNLTKFIVDNLDNSDRFLNDMDILGRYALKRNFPCDPDNNKIHNERNYIFDGAAIGQYLGGVDPNNLNDYTKNPVYKYVNPTKGFINETAIFKPDGCIYKKKFVITDVTKKPVGVYICKKLDETRINRIANLHIHSKQVYQFSSIFDYNYNDIITGDRVISLCDFVLTIKPIYENHKNIEKYAKDVILIKNPNNVNFDMLNNFLTDKYIEKGKTDVEDKSIKLFIYTHTLEYFTKHIAPKLNPHLTYIIYTHNSDHSFNEKHKDLLSMRCIKYIYSQNIDYPIHNKLKFLPIGIANSMWNHGNLYNLYTSMKNTYKYKKTESIYVNINPQTYNYRGIILSKIKEKGKLTLANPKPHIEYLKELSKYRFCLAIRGNGIDTHRFWESLYLGVIPVIINNKTTNCNNFVNYIKKEKIPFYEITEENINDIVNKYTDDFFSKELYEKILDNMDNYIYSLDALKLGYYKT